MRQQILDLAHRLRGQPLEDIQVSDCYGSGNFATWCKFATFSVSPDETAKNLCGKHNSVEVETLRGQAHAVFIGTPATDLASINSLAVHCVTSWIECTALVVPVVLNSVGMMVEQRSIPIS